MNNLMYHRDEQGLPVGVLIDFDLARIIPLDAPRTTDRVGSVPFMSYYILWGMNCPYGLHHDLESYLYCAIWHGMGYRTSSAFPCVNGSTNDILYNWRAGSFRSMGDAKVDLLSSRAACRILRNIPDKEYAFKCLNMRNKFVKALDEEFWAPISDDDDSDDESEWVHPREDISLKISYRMVMDALGMEGNKCDEPCCLRKKIQSPRGEGGNSDVVQK